MCKAVKKILLQLVDFLGWIWHLLPGRLRTNFITGLYILESRGKDPVHALRRLFVLQDRLDWVSNERAMAYGQGEHPKHRLTRYHDFFIEHITDGERVLDVGCGYGAVARSIAHAHTRCEVVGIDQDRSRLTQARASNNPPNLRFVEGDATRGVPEGPWNAVILSNVLEHIVDRTGFLHALQNSTSASRYLIRVPLFERDWQMALRRELGVDFRSDADHKTEHTLTEFQVEVTAAGLVAIEVLTLWGEIWADCRLAGANGH